MQAHGDGAFTGQGCVWETLALGSCPHFRIGGTLHLVVNNQVAFTAEGHIGRSTTHCTDIAKAFETPIFHVNGDYPEVLKCRLTAHLQQLVKALRLAVDYRDRFRKDVFINLCCYRLHGHNELGASFSDLYECYRRSYFYEPGNVQRDLIEEKCC